VCEIVLSDWPEIHSEIVAAGDGEMAAQFQERCAQEAIRRFWKVGVNDKGERIEHPAPQIANPSSPFSELVRATPQDFEAMGYKDSR